MDHALCHGIGQPAPSPSQCVSNSVENSVLSQACMSKVRVRHAEPVWARRVCRSSEPEIPNLSDVTSMLRPIGPEPAWIYWLRRTLILGVGLIVVVAAAAVIMKSSGASAVSADPPPAEPTGPTAPPVTASWTTPTPSSLPSSPSSAGSMSASPSGLGTSATPTSIFKPTPTATKSAHSTCEDSELRTTLTGKRALKLKEPATFALSVINGGEEACAVTVDSKNFQLRIYSGSDRIWSTRDCSSLVTPISTQLDSQQAVEWKITWNGLRSASGCEEDSESLEAGDYVATAEFSDAEPVKLRMIVSD